MNNNLGIVVMESFPDNGNVNANTSNANFPNVGGNATNSAGNVGIFYCNVNNNSTNNNTSIGSRNSGIISRSMSFLKQHLEKSTRPCLLTKHEGNNDNLVHWYSTFGIGRCI